MKWYIRLNVLVSGFHSKWVIVVLNFFNSLLYILDNVKIVCPGGCFGPIGAVNQRLNELEWMDHTGR